MGYYYLTPTLPNANLDANLDANHWFFICFVITIWRQPLNFHLTFVQVWLLHGKNLLLGMTEWFSWILAICRLHRSHQHQKTVYKSAKKALLELLHSSLETSKFIFTKNLNGRKIFNFSNSFPIRNSVKSMFSLNTYVLCILLHEILFK